MIEELLPIHPKLVHFPIALFFTALGFEILSLVFRKDSFHKTAFYLFVTAVLASVIAVRSGLWEAARLHLNHPVLARHRTFGLWTMWVSVVSLPVLWVLKVFNPKIFQFVFIIVLLGIAGLVTVTSHFGGDMVYEYGAGMKN